MTPYFVIMIFALVGALKNGVVGFAVWGCLAILGTLVFGWVLGKLNGGVILRKLRDETATDFVASHTDLIRVTYQDMSPFQAKERVSTILEDIMKRALRNDPSYSTIVNPHVFFSAASEIAEQQPTITEKEMAKAFVEFLRVHRLWKLRWR